MNAHIPMKVSRTVEELRSISLVTNPRLPRSTCHCEGKRDVKTNHQVLFEFVGNTVFSSEGAKGEMIGLFLGLFFGLADFQDCSSYFIMQRLSIKTLILIVTTQGKTAVPYLEWADRPCCISAIELKEERRNI